LPPGLQPKVQGLSGPHFKRGRKKQTKSQYLLDRLENHEDCVFAFLHDFQIPFTSNQAEQDVRMIKVKRNCSGAQSVGV